MGRKGNIDAYYRAIRMLSRIYLAVANFMPHKAMMVAFKNVKEFIKQPSLKICTFSTLFLAFNASLQNYYSQLLI